MLQNRKIKLLLICVIISINHSEQRQQGQSQIQGRKNLPPQNLQQQQQQQQPQIRQLDQRIIQERPHKAREMLKFMYLEGDACKDFYDFACGKWLQEQKTDKANEGDLISVHSEMEQFVNKQLQAILNEPIVSKEDMSVKVVKDFYRSCLRVPATSPAQNKFMHRIVLNHGGLPDIQRIGWQPNYNWIHVIADLRRKYGLDILIGLTIERTNPNHKAIYIEEPRTTLLPVELCSALAARQIDEKDQVFDRIQNEIKDNLRNIFELTESNALRIAGSILRFEFDLCKYMRIDQLATTPLDEMDNEALNTNRRGHPARIVENKMHGVRQSTTNNLRSLRSLSDNYQIDFKDFIERSLDTTTVSQVYFRSEEYFQQLSSIARKGLQASFAHYIMYRALSEISFPLNERNDQRPFNCANQVMRYLPQVLGKLYADKFSDEESRQDMRDMFSIIKQSFSKYLLTDVNWMADNTKRAVNQKVATLKITFPSYPPNVDVLRGLPLHDDQDYWHKLETIMMYNANQTIQQVRLTNDHSNFIEAPAVTIQQKPLAYELVAGYGLLQKPFYSPVYANSLKYSSIGVAMAREIIKIFDYQGLQQNPMNTFPWDPATMESFPLISECFRAQISNYFHNNPNVYRNATKLRDIMVETSALNVAFNAYIHWLELPHRQRSELQMETLPNMNFTNTQLFFINFAQTHCAAHHKAKIVPEFLPLYRRTMEQYDINGPVSNNVEFSRDFSCEVGADMNLDDKCLLY